MEGEVLEDRGRGGNIPLQVYIECCSLWVRDVVCEEKTEKNSGKFDIRFPSKILKT